MPRIKHHAKAAKHVAAKKPVAAPVAKVAPVKVKTVKKATPTVKVLSIRETLKKGQKKSYVVQGVKLVDTSWKMQVTRSGGTFRDFVVIQTIGYMPKAGDKVIIERNASDTVDYKQVLTVTKA